MQTKKSLILSGIVLVILIVGYLALSMREPSMDLSDKIHVDLYEEANGVWDAQMHVTPFERLSSSMLSLAWQAPEADYNHFVLTISQSDGTFIRKESGEHDRLSLDPDGLEPQTEYVFALQACLDPRCESWYIAQEEYRGTTQAQATETETETTN